MSKKINHNEHDALGELFRQRLENHRLPVESDGWSEIEGRLGKTKNSKVVWFRSVGATAAAAIALLLFVNVPSGENSSGTEISRQVAANNITDREEESAISAEIREQNTGRKEVPASVPGISDQSKQTEKEADRHFDTETTTTNVILSSVPSDEITTGVPKTAEQTEILIAAKENQTDTPVNERGQLMAQADINSVKLDFSLVEDKPDEDPPRKEPGKWLLAAAFGAGTGNRSLDNSASQHNMSSAPSSEYASDKTNSIRPFEGLTSDYFSDITHNVPMSFGLTARKNLGKHWGVESGLVYTFLSTSFKWSGYDVRQRLHYIGVPINMVAYLWKNNPNWRIYLSGGAMVEKGLRNISTQEERRGDRMHTMIVKTSVDGFQWSVNGALGVNYKIAKGFGLYFEPRLSYCFDNDQPISMRTEWPLSVGINVGLNYEF